MRGEYNTRQKREMLSFLQKHDLKSFSVDDLAQEMQSSGEKIGRTTVYRYLEQLAEQGRVRKYQNPQGVIQYQHVEDIEACDAHFHMMCKNCGQLYHVNCTLMHTLAQHVYTDHGFRLDSRETILMGVCAHCSGAQEGEKDHGSDHAERCHHCL